MTQGNSNDPRAENLTTRPAAQPSTAAAPTVDGDTLSVELPVAGWHSIVAVLDRSARANAARGGGGRHADLADDIARQAGLTQRPWQSERQP